jgi:hypothetical protein
MNFRKKSERSLSSVSGALAFSFACAAACTVDRQDGATASGGVAGLGGGVSQAGRAGGGNAGRAGSGGSSGATASGGRESGSGGSTAPDAGNGGEPAGGAGTGGTSGGAIGEGGSSGADTSLGGAPTNGGGPAAGGVLGSGGLIGVGGKASGGTTGNGGTTGSGGALGAGGSAKGGAANGGTLGSGGLTGSGGAGDVTPPTIVSITPSNLASGVPSNSTIKITFSETMNTASVTSALKVSSFSAANLTLSWDGTGRTLTVTPSGGFVYATGTSPSTTTATKYTVTISNAAKDVAGNSLAAFSSSFSTLRRISQTLTAESAGSYSDYGHAVGDGPIMCPTYDPTRVNKWSSIASAGTYYTFAAFDTTPMGSPADIVTIESATLGAVQSAPDGDFYTAHVVLAKKVQYQAIDKNVLSAAVTDNLGTFSSSAATNPSINVLSAFKPDIASGNQHQLYRLEPSGNADSSHAYFTCAGFTLKVTFLSP